MATMTWPRARKSLRSSCPTATGNLTTMQNDFTEVTRYFRALNDHHVFLEGTLLKPNMVTAG